MDTHFELKYLSVNYQFINIEARTLRSSEHYFFYEGLPPFPFLQ